MQKSLHWMAPTAASIGKLIPNVMVKIGEKDVLLVKRAEYHARLLEQS